MKLTLDWNCVIEVEEQRPQARFVSELVFLHRAGDVEVALLAASASENSKSKRFPGSASLFFKRIRALGWMDIPLVPMPAIIGLSYLDCCFIVGDGEEYRRDMDALWNVIAPKVPRRISEYLLPGMSLPDAMIQSEALWRWRNAWCDVVSAYSHIHAGRDVFITNNTKHFQKNFEKLADLGMRRISTPSEFCSRMNFNYM